MKYSELENNIVSNGLCIGCGACSYQIPSAISMELNELGMYQPTLIEQSDVHLENVCPMHNNSLTETDLAPSDTKHFNKDIGNYDEVFCGHVIENNWREIGSSGGITNWLLCELLNTELIDGVVHVGKAFNSTKLFEYRFKDNVADVKADSKSQYYPIELSSILSEIKKRDKRVAIVAVPCFTKAIKLICRNDKKLSDLIKFNVTLVCGHLKSAQYAKFLAWQSGIDPEKLRSIDFRVQLQGKTSNKYGTKFEFYEKNIVCTKTVDNSLLRGTDWGLGYFKPNACEFCDDVFGELSDVTIGDAWLPRYLSDGGGTNLIVSRNNLISTILERAQSLGRLKLDVVSEADVLLSQKAGLKHKRVGLAHRLSMQKTGLFSYTIRKRVQPKFCENYNERQKTELRYELSKQSHIIFKKALDERNLEIFTNNIDILNEKYYKTIFPFWKRLLKNVFKWLRRI